MTGDARIFNSINTNGNDGYDSITFGDNGKGKIKGLGKIAIYNDMSISNVLLVESFNFNLLSVAQLCDLGFKCIFGVDDLDMRIYTWLISMLVELNYLHVCSLSLAWVGYGIEGLVMLK